MQEHEIVPSADLLSYTFPFISSKCFIQLDAQIILGELTPLAIISISQRPLMIHVTVKDIAEKIPLRSFKSLDTAIGAEATDTFKEQTWIECPSSTLTALTDLTVEMTP